MSSVRRHHSRCGGAKAGLTQIIRLSSYDNAPDDAYVMEAQMLAGNDYCDAVLDAALKLLHECEYSLKLARAALRTTVRTTVASRSFSCMRPFLPTCDTDEIVSSGHTSMNDS